MPSMAASSQPEVDHLLLLRFHARDNLVDCRKVHVLVERNDAGHERVGELAGIGRLQEAAHILAARE